MENYIHMNGQKIRLNEEQIKIIANIIGLFNNPFNRCNENEIYYYIDIFGDVHATRELNRSEDVVRYNNANYFTNKEVAEQVALHQLLYRKLLKYSYDNGAVDEAWDGGTEHYWVSREEDCNEYWCDTSLYKKNFGEVYFSSSDVAQQAIKDVIEPFLKKHPNFKW